jgi:hypothetical protein
MSAASRTTATADGWTTVASRRSTEAPAARPTFGSGSRPEAPAAFGSSRPTFGRPTQQLNHGTALRTERAAEATRTAALDFASTNAYPVLGAPAGRSRPSASAAFQRPALDFRGAAAAAAAREDATVSASAAADAYEEEYARRRRERLAAAEAERLRHARLAAIGTRCHDDGPEDYDGPEENDEDYVPAGTGTTDDWADAAGGYEDGSGDSFSATRRRGDHGVW